MTIKLIAIGKIDHAALQSLIDLYTNRLHHYAKIDYDIIPNLKRTKNLSISEQKLREGRLILKKIMPNTVVVLLDENGTQLNSIAFSSLLQKKMNSGIKQLVFVIGGSYGFSNEVYKRANQQLSFSKMTFSHQMIRLFFVEQLYRAFTIINHEPYHHK